MSKKTFSTNLVDLSQTITDMPVFSPGVPVPSISAWMSHDESAASGSYRGCTCEITQVSFVTSIGTYLDSPYHFHPGADSIDQLELEQLVLPGVVIDCTQLGAGQPIHPDSLNGVDLTGKAVLVHTGWSQFWGDPTYFEHPFVSEETAVCLREGGAKLVGIDCLVVDDRKDRRRPAHVNLLAANVLIVENLTNLAALPEEGFVFHAVPVKVEGAAAFPVRAYGVVLEANP